MNIQLGINPAVRVSYGGLKNLSIKPQDAAPTLAQGPGDPDRPSKGFLDTVTRGMVVGIAETGAVLQNDPALAVREFATRVHEGASRGYGSADLQAWAPMVGIGARTLILGANALRLKRTFGTESSSLLERGLDVARVATDLMGVAGAVLRVAAPEHAALGTTLMGIAQSADLVSHGSRFGMHSAPRVTDWLKAHEERQARQREREKRAALAEGLT